MTVNNMTILKAVLIAIAVAALGLILGLLLLDQSTKPASSSMPSNKIQMVWQKNLEETTFKNDQILVGSDGRVYAEIEKDSGVWYVWHNGAGYGQYVSEKAAKEHAEEVAKRLGMSTQ